MLSGKCSVTARRVTGTIRGGRVTTARYLVQVAQLRRARTEIVTYVRMCTAPTQ